MSSHRVPVVLIFTLTVMFGIACGRPGGPANDPGATPTPDGTQPLSVSINVTETSGIAPLSVVFSAQVTGGTTPYYYSWLFGDGGWSVDPSPAYTYDGEGTFNAYVLITDAVGALAEARSEVVVGDNPPLPSDLVIQSFDARVIFADDNFEPNDTVGTYVGAAPMFTQMFGYLDTRTIELTASVTNQGEGDAEAFDLEIFKDSEDAPEAAAEADIVRPVPEGLAAGSSTEITFTIENAEGSRWASWLRVEDELDNVDVVAVEDVDRFRFYQDAGYEIYVTLDLLPKDYDLVLFSPSGSYVGSYSGGTFYEHIGVTAPYSGFYTAKVYSYDGKGDSDDFYRLTIDLP